MRIRSRSAQSRTRAAKVPCTTVLVVRFTNTGWSRSRRVGRGIRGIHDGGILIGTARVRNLRSGRYEKIELGDDGTRALFAGHVGGTG